MDRFKPSLALLLGSLLALPGAVAATAEPAGELLFRVLLDDKDIGVHRFLVAREDERELVRIEADFDVTFFAIPVYSYDHRNRETWNNGCLERIESRTDDNGDEFRVEGEDRGDRFVVSTQDATIELEADCVMSFAYWNRDFLSQARLLNAQTGEYLPVSVEELGTETLRLGDASMMARRYRLLNREEEIDINVWYDAGSGRWLSLESRVGGDRVLRYLPLADAAADAARQRLAANAASAADAVPGSTPQERTR